MRSLRLVGALALFLATASSASAATVRLIVRHPVTDYTAWRQVYDGFDATRRTLGVTAQSVYRSVDDSTDITVFHDFKTTDKAKAFAASPQLKDAMSKAGVSGEPKMWFLTPAGGSMRATTGTFLFVHHAVKDFVAWHKVYDAFDATRRKLGVIGHAVYRSVDDPNDVFVIHLFKTTDEARSFAASPELKEAMEKAGVSGAPDIWFTTRAAK